MSDFVNIWKNLDWTVPVQMVMNILPSLLCITLHELSHGYVAYLLGDTTAKDAGRLTLNPIKHIDIMGLLMMVVFRFGWAKPVPVNMYRFKNPKKGMAVTALAGPVCNLLLAGVFLFLYGLLYYPLYVRGGAVAETILLSEGKQEFYRGIIRRFGQKKGLQVYKAVKSDFSGLKKK